MIIVTPTSSSSFGPSKMLEKTTASVDSPPAYNDIGGVYGGDQGIHSAQSYRIPPSRRNRDANGANPLMHARPVYSPQATVDQVHIFDRKHNIQGTFCIDPLVPALDPSRRAGKHRSKELLPHASFRTRKGMIDLDLATVGDSEKAPKARVAVASRSGQIKLNLLPTPPSCPRIGLDVNSRHGNIILFLPEGYTGVVQLATRKGKMDVLPALASRMKVVKSSDREIIFMIGNAHEGVDTSREASFCEASTRTGDILIGLAGRDQYVPKPGLWQRIGTILRGEPSDTKICGRPKEPCS